MYLITNRAILTASGHIEDVFDDTPNIKGPNELRVSTVKKSGSKWRAKVLDDKLPKSTVKRFKNDFNLKIDPEKQHYVDLQVACDIVSQARREKRNILVFVHGFNNDVEEVLQRASQLEKNYNIIVLPFWPANGGGIKGVADYKDDKNDAKASTVALDRLLKFISRNLSLVTESNLEDFWNEAKQRYPNDPEKSDALYSRLVEKNCPFTLNLMLHSMGNYLLKQMFKSTISRGTDLIFDNVIMCAADANNLDHSLWVDRIRFNRRLYITINENDNALSASRMKSGQDQLARLGHVLYGLNAAKVHYVNFTDSAWVGNSHAYFEGNARARNKSVREFFKAAFNGNSADDVLKYRADMNCYELK
jgi:esterase/lipase superfamily enzyme